MNSNRSSKQGRAQAKAKKPSQNNKAPKKDRKLRTSEVGAARFQDQARRVGMRDLRSHEVSYIAGYVYVGDGTNGATDSVYFRSAGANAATPGNTGGGQVPVLPSDSYIGQSYVRDVEKHYSRKWYKRIHLSAVSVQPATSNSMVFAIAPGRGCGQSGDVVNIWGATTAAPTLQNTLGMAGAKSAASWQTLDLDLTPYIAGGSGGDQKEFNISVDGDSSQTAWGVAGMDLTGIAPCTFTVAGTNSTAALRGTNTHYILVTTIVDYLDFIGGNSVVSPLAFTMTEDELRTMFRLMIQSQDKGVREGRVFKGLLQHFGRVSSMTDVKTML